MFGKKIIIVEDDEDIRTSLVELLLDEGYFVSTFNNGADALQSILSKKEAECDLIVLDLQMPIMNGYQFSDKLREYPEHESLPIIVMSAENHSESKLSFNKINRYVKKPLDIAHFLDTIEQCLDLDL